MIAYKRYARRSFVVLLIFSLLAAGGWAALAYYGQLELDRAITAALTPEMSATALLEQVTAQHAAYSRYLIAACAGLSLIGGLFIWLILRVVARRSLVTVGGEKPGAAPKKAAVSGNRVGDSQPLRERRLFLHLLAVLQREGRLVDFFEEDLSHYADAQIGAAVRTIHDSCRKILVKRLALAPILPESEGEAITVAAGFDPDAIKLTGQVTGDPPFAGVVRHKGWRVQKADLPDLTAVKDPSVIAPAEVEIQ